VIELASALASMKERPKRSILFLTFYGEERGMLGSTHYGRNPLVPLARTIAAINLEHMGRTDDVEGKRENELSMTGFDFSDMGPIFNEAGKPFGVKTTKHPTNSDAFFARSDNVALARVGIPSHTLCTAFIFPEYHKVGDHWDKVDYANLERVLKAVGNGILTMADNPAEPKWNEANSKTARYVEAWKALRGG
jgi:Zn-dependent M28 family amino/carboxypeptidase